MGLFEKDEVGDDTLPDVLFRESAKNCASAAQIYRSLSPRVYTKGTTTPSCDLEKHYPGNSIEELKDADRNGIPDYMEGLMGIDPNDPDSVRDFQDQIEGVLDTLNKDSDGDGIPDEDDSLDSISELTDFMSSTEELL